MIMARDATENLPFAIRAFSPEQLKEALRKMHLIRLFEEGAEESYMRGLIHGTMHLSIGQEASAVATCMELSDTDKITSTHRGHGHCIAKGADVGRMFAEFFGKETGYCHGRGGSMHIADIKTGNLGANGIVGGGLPIAVGATLTAKRLGKDGCLRPIRTIVCRCVKALMPRTAPKWVHARGTPTRSSQQRRRRASPSTASVDTTRTPAGAAATSRLKTVSSPCQSCSRSAAIFAET